MGLSLNACVLLSYYVLTMHCGSSLVLSPSFYRFHEKWPYQEKNCHPQKERKIGGREKNCHPQKERKIGGRSATVPHHTRLL